jgi:hypothetical protein
MKILLFIYFKNTFLEFMDFQPNNLNFKMVIDSIYVYQQHSPKGESMLKYTIKCPCFRME